LQGGGDLNGFVQQALAHRDAQEMESAYAVILRADANDPQSAFAHAQIAFETGRPALDLFAKAAPLNPDNPALIRTYAAALAEQGALSDAVALLETTLAANPDWLDGHRLLGNLRVTSGELDPARSIAEAVRRHPDTLSLRLAWFQALSVARQWDAALAVVADAIARFGDKPALRSAKVYIASESGESPPNPDLFDSVADITDAGLDIARIRHALRLGDITRAETVAEAHIGQPTAAIFWPYLSIIWRLTGDPRAAWLEGNPPPIRSFDLDFTPVELADLTETLNRLHTAKAPYPEQSVRGGTQTSGQLFFRHEPAIQNARAKVSAAVANYVAALPPHDPTHPLLATPRDRPILFEGSWSVRLAAQGFHSRHTHTRGWISSALYVALPKLNAPPAGWIEFGVPPPELNLDLPAYAQIEPKPGRLVLFPSTLWHGTVPFDDGERLTIAFDVRVPKAAPQHGS
jgi:tetratricopeptide (TPR) repeat protein